MSEFVNMINYPVLVVRIILGMALGVLLTRIFRPEWSVVQGLLLGGGLVAAAYLLQTIRQRNTRK